MDFYIRPPRVSDAEDINLIRRMPGTFETILGLPSEPVENTIDFLSQADLATHHELAAAVRQENGTELVVATAGLSFSSNPRLRHSASFGIMVRTDYQALGIGKALTAAVLDLADNWLMLKRVELTVFTDNEPAIHLYESFGFEREGLKRMAVIRQGRYADEYLMARLRGGAEV